MVKLAAGGTIHLLESGRRPAFSLGVIVSLVLHGTGLGLYLLASRIEVETVPDTEQMVAFFAPLNKPKGHGAASEIRWAVDERRVGADGLAPAAASEQVIGRLAAGESDTLLTRDQVDPLLQLLGESVLTELEVDSAVRRDPSSAAPEYPLDLLGLNIEGSAFVLYVVDSTGEVDTRTYRVVRATHPGFAAAVQRALPRMRFSPAVLHGQPVRQLVQQNFAFRIQRPDTSRPPSKPPSKPPS
ncbi:MAG: energy transducer TonB [Gemmatimonadota bacterium]